MARHLKYNDSPYQYSDFGNMDLTNHPAVLSLSATIVEGPPPQGAELKDNNPENDLKEAIRNLDIQLQLALGSIVAIANSYLEDKQFDKVRDVISNAPNPFTFGTNEYNSLEVVRTQLIQLVP